MTDELVDSLSKSGRLKKALARKKKAASESGKKIAVSLSEPGAPKNLKDMLSRIRQNMHGEAEREKEEDDLPQPS